MLKDRVFVVIGSDFLNRKRAIDNIKTKLLKKRELALNTQVLYAREIDLISLRELLFSFSFDGDRIIIFKEAQNLSKQVKDFIYKNLKSIIGNNYLIFDIERDYASLKKDKSFLKDRFFSYLFRYAYLLKLSSFKEDISIQKFLVMVRKNRVAQAIYILEKIFDIGSKKKEFLGIQILGALTREFSYIKNPLEKERYFNLIWETDRALKEGRVEPRLALELLVTKILLI